ncbi:MAG: 30S ribosomal protein S17e [Nanoarchaeota archaeon]
MGRIKSTLIKRTSKQLVNSESAFNESFDNNKKILGSTMPSKKMRNKIAGYIARVVRLKREHAVRELRRKEQAQERLIQDIQQVPQYEQ